MSKNVGAIIILISLTLLAACAPATPVATETPPPSLTPTVAASDTPALTPTPTGADAAATPDIFTELNPASTPLKKWNNLPIMPGAIAGDGNDTSYYFTTKATQDAIKSYYDQQMKTLGYDPLAVGNGEGGAVVLFYQSASGATADISLFTKNDTILVMFVK